jgi:Na+-translocating ferredoxin:NAD+ oxidoreductase subunit B
MLQMNEILIPILIVAGIGLLCGLILAFASIVMAVPKMKKQKPSAICFPAQTAAPAAFPAATATRKRWLPEK